MFGRRTKGIEIDEFKGYVHVRYLRFIPSMRKIQDSYISMDPIRVHKCGERRDDKCINLSKSRPLFHILRFHAIMPVLTASPTSSKPDSSPTLPHLPPELLRIISSSLSRSSSYVTLSSLTLTSSSHKSELSSFLERGREFYRVVDERHGGVCGVGWEGRLNRGQKRLIR